MATKSFLKNVNLRSRSQCESFIKAVERSQERKPQKIDMANRTKDMNKDQIRKIFGGE